MQSLSYPTYTMYLAQIDVAGLLSAEVRAIGVLLVVLICLIFEVGIVTKGRLVDAQNALAESEKRADASEARLETERKENTDVIVSMAMKFSDMEQKLEESREETRKLHSSAETAMKIQNTLMKQMGAVLVKHGITPPPKEENEWGS